LMWDEPVAAESALIACTFDADEDVREHAYEALDYYSSRAVIKHVAEHREVEQAAKLYDDFRGKCVDALQTATHYSPKGVQRLLDWMQPIADPLQISDDEMVFHPSPTGAPLEKTKVVMPVDEVLEQLQDLGGKWAPKYDLIRDFDWSIVENDRRSEIGEFFLHHIDPEVRSWACHVFGEWKDAERLVQLAADPKSFVRKSAIYNLGLVSHSDDIAQLAWDLIVGGSVASTPAHEALQTYATHAPKDEIDARCLELIRTDRRESVRYEASSLLSNELVGEVLYVLDQEPLVTWLVHSMILAMCHVQKICPPQVDQLWSVDNLQIASDLAGLEEFRS
jgi:hypothetical protein